MQRDTHRAFMPALLVTATLTACAHLSTDAGFPEAQQLVEQRTGHHIVWQREDGPSADAEASIGTLLSQPLTCEASIRVAFLRSPALQAEYERLGIAQADLIEAGLLDNPVVSGSARFPDGGASGANVELAVVQSFVDMLMRPARQRIGEVELERTQYRVAHAALTVAADVQRVYYTLLAAVQIQHALQEHARATAAAAEFAARLSAAGNLDTLALTREQAGAAEAMLEARRAAATVMAAREDLRRRLGLRPWDAEPRLPTSLPQLPASDPTLEDLESVALDRRLDLQVALREVEIFRQSLAQAERWRWFPLVEVGISAERDVDTQWVTGPTLSLALPLFDRKQATMRRLQSYLRESQRRVEQLEIDIRSQVREQEAAVRLTRELAEGYRDVLLPLRRRAFALTQQHYNYMLIGTIDLLIARQQEMESYRNYVAAVRDYWVARGELGRVTGGALPPADATPAIPPVITSPPAEPGTPVHGPQHRGPMEIEAPASVPTSAPTSQPMRHDREGE